MVGGVLELIDNPDGRVTVDMGAPRLRWDEIPLAEPFEDTTGIELQVGPTPLPYAAAPTLVYYDPAEILQRTGSPAAVHHYLQLMHRHHLTTVHRPGWTVPCH